jgi:predicted lipid carrier protein YhbT
MPPDAPPFSPTLLFGLAVRPLPDAVVRRLASPVVAAAARTLAPHLADRLGGLSGTVAVLPTDFPYGIAFRIVDGTVSLSVAGEAEAAAADARIRAPALVLLDLAGGGERDGDASFFTRDLSMEGDTGLVMALRYALEEAALDPATLLAGALPLPAAIKARLPGRLEAVLARASTDAATLQAALLAPVEAWRAGADRRLAAVEARLDEAERGLRRRAPRSATGGSHVAAS